MPRALILGGTGLIGGATARRLRASGWTVDAPGSMDFDSPKGYGANKVAAEHTLLDSGLPVTVLRPSKEGAAR
ncbi:hypothetical protein BBK82_26985 [Lentzea guizhouensis]|uniref:NAD-dependent epimerase/dehydratase domain-containing protein n=1 Tax=Lentzea guizhouensis TaxID=1586287 RepID=A0A1B2HN71_9PSEU|nr:hypothetical protein [Lentzea guizhouensis]ANZ39177.1 hypothetical protein BBK82_26985 [Lentzea guizhouensis]